MRLRPELVLTTFAIILTVGFAAAVVYEFAGWLVMGAEGGEWPALVGGSLTLLVTDVLVYGGLVYQVTRLGFLLRLRGHRPLSQHELLQMSSASPAVVALRRSDWLLGGRHHSGDPGITPAIAPGVTLAILGPRRTLTPAIHRVDPV